MCPIFIAENLRFFFIWTSGRCRETSGLAPNFWMWKEMPGHISHASAVDASPPLPQEPCSLQHSSPRPPPGPPSPSPCAGLEGVPLSNLVCYTRHTTLPETASYRNVAVFSPKNWRHLDIIGIHRGFFQNLGHPNGELRAPLPSSRLA